MADYVIYWAPITDPTALQGELPVQTFTYSDVLNAPGAIQGTFPLNPYPTAPDLLTADTFGEARTVVWVVRDGVPMWSGIMWAWTASVDADQVTFNGEGWHSYYRRRRIPVTLDYPFTDQALIARGLIRSGHSWAFPDELVNTSIATHGVPRKRTYYWWENRYIGEAVEQLAAVANGFDFRFTPRATAPQVYTCDFTTEHPPTGRPTDHVFQLEVNCAIVNASSDGKSYANTYRAYGSGVGIEVTYVDAFDSSTMPPNIPMDDGGSFPDVIETATLTEHAERGLLRASTPTRLIELEVYPDTEPGVGAYTVGDRCLITATRGFLRLDRAQYRIVARQIDVDENGTETVGVTCAPLGMFL